MKGLKVQCPSCKKVFHETTEKYDPDVRPNGAMVRLLDPWKGWGWAAFDAEGEAVSTTLCSEMLCPSCAAPLAPSGRLTVITPSVEKPHEESAPLVETKKCPKCGRGADLRRFLAPDEDKAICYACGWVGTVQDLLDKESIPLQETASLNDQVDAEVTHAEEPPAPGLKDGVGVPSIAPVEPPAPKQKTKKKANTLKKKAKKRK